MTTKTKPAPVVPVQILPCPICRGSGWVETRINTYGGGEGRECAYCAGRGRIATEQGEV